MEHFMKCLKGRFESVEVVNVESVEVVNKSDGCFNNDPEVSHVESDNPYSIASSSWQ